MRTNRWLVDPLNKLDCRCSVRGATGVVVTGCDVTPCETLLGGPGK